MDEKRYPNKVKRALLEEFYRNTATLLAEQRRFYARSLGRR